MFPSASRGHSDLGAIARQLDAVAVEIGEIDRFAHAMVGHALDGHAGVDDAAHRAREIAARWIANREMVEACMVGRRREFRAGSARY